MYVTKMEIFWKFFKGKVYLKNSPFLSQDKILLLGIKIVDAANSEECYVYKPNDLLKKLNYYIICPNFYVKQRSYHTDVLSKHAYFSEVF